MPRLENRNTADRLDAAGFDISHLGETYRIILKRTARARRFTLRIRVATRDVVLTMPAQGRLGDARTFAQRHAAWIGARLARLPADRHFSPGECVPLRGDPHEIRHRPDTRGTVWIEVGNADSESRPTPLLCVGGDASFVPRRVRDYLTREARRDLEAAIARHSENLGVRPSKVTLRDTTSRWGSCSSTGSLNFSWRLIMAPSFVLDYLAAHEVAHLKHMNHSPAFWIVVARLSKDTERAEAWLKAHSAGLLRFGQARGAAVPARTQAGGTSVAPAAAATSSRRFR